MTVKTPRSFAMIREQENTRGYFLFIKARYSAGYPSPSRPTGALEREPVALSAVDKPML